MERRGCCVLLLLSLSAATNADPITDDTTDGLPLSCGPSVNGSCEMRRLVTAHGASVLLPCQFRTRPQHAVSWTHAPAVPVVTVTSAGRVNFLETRRGRIKTFPNEGSRGNFSIAIDSVLDSDFGCYLCRHDDTCIQVELVLRPESEAAPFPFFVYIICAAVTLCAVGLGLFLWGRPCLKGGNHSEEHLSITVHHHDNDVCFQAPEDDRAAADSYAEAPASPSYENAIVYENAAHEAGAEHRDAAASCSDRDQALRHSHRTKIRFHSELMSRLRQASLGRHHYVNQSELQEATKGRQFQNPIYHRGADWDQA